MQITEQLSCFSVPIFKLEVPDSDRLNQELKRDSLMWQESSKSVYMSNEGGSWHSPPQVFLRKEASFKTLSKHIVSTIGVVVNQINPRFQFDEYDIKVNGWVNVNKTFAYNSVHNHGEFHLSGCYYVCQPAVSSGKSGMIEFINSRNDGDLHAILGGIEFAKKIQLRPKPGQMLCFPATVMHSVHPNETNDLRISIAWNALFAKRT